MECLECGRALDRTTGRSLDAALACSVTTFLLLFPMNLLPIMTVHILGIPNSTRLASGLTIFWQQGWPLAAVVLALLGIVLPFVHFGLLSVTLCAIRYGSRAQWLGRAFRYCEVLDLWAMSDVVLIGAGIGYGRMVSQIPVIIDPGGWCLVGAAFMTMLTRASLERRAVWRMLEPAPGELPAQAVSCVSCDLVLPPELEGGRCPRCGERIHRRRPYAMVQCTALTAATWALSPIAYAYPMSSIWEAGSQHPHNIIDGILLLFGHGFWYFGVIIFCVSVLFPLTKLVGLTWFLLSVWRGWTTHLRFKTKLYRFVDDVGRWSVLDPFTVMIFTPMVQFGQLGHFNAMGGSEAFLATVVLSMLAARCFDPRLIWDVASARRVRDPVQKEAADLRLA